LFESQHFWGFIKILFAALIASDPEVGIDSRAGSDGICLGKYDSISEQYILPNVVPMVLAQHHPTITAVFPHRSSLQAVTSVGWTFSGANERKSPGISDFNSISTQHHTLAAHSRQYQVALAAWLLPGTSTLFSPTAGFLPAARRDFPISVATRLLAPPWMAYWSGSGRITHANGSDDGHPLKATI
jgi:hypothetical protein